MKKIIALVLAGIICALALFSCAKGELKEKDILDKDGNKIATGFYDGDRLVREEKTDSNGDLSQKTEYNKDGKVEKVESYTLGILFSEEEYKYEKEDGKYSKTTVTYNNKGDVVSNKETKYKDSLPVEEIKTTPTSDKDVSYVERTAYTYNEDGTILLSTTSDGKKINEKLLDKDGNVVYVFEFSEESSVKTFYNKKNVILKTETYNKDNKLVVTIENEYDSNGKQTGSKTYNSKGELRDYSVYVYGSDRLLGIYKYNADDTIKYTIAYDSNGKATVYEGAYMPLGK